MRRNPLLAGLLIAMAWGQAPPSTPPNTQPNSPPRPGLPEMNDPTYRPGAGATTDTTQMPPRVDDKKLLKEAAMGGMTEVELGKLAAQKASNDAVKQFAQKIVDDHTKAVEELKQIAGKESVPVPESLDSKHRSRVDKLSKLSGADF